MNLPNKLTVLRLIMVPIIIVVMLLPLGTILSGVLAAAIFGLTALTDMLDGKIARKYNLITDFGKFLDPLADKFMVISVITVFIYQFGYDSVLQACCLVTTLIVIMRELAVTSIRLVVSSSAGIVVAANKLGKIKTVTQIIYILCAMLEPVIFEVIDMVTNAGFTNYHVLTYVSMAAMTVFTIWSGINYLSGYWKYLDPSK